MPAQLIRTLSSLTEDDYEEVRAYLEADLLQCGMEPAHLFQLFEAALQPIVNAFERKKARAFKTLEDHKRQVVVYGLKPAGVDYLNALVDAFVAEFGAPDAGE
jgi:hypothetical protein